MSVLITGAGFLARGLVRELLLRGEQRICLYSRGEYAQFLFRQEFNNDSRLRFLIGDVRDKDRLKLAMRGVKTVIHAAALKRVEVGAYNPTEMMRTNIEGTQNVIDAATDAGVQIAVLVSSDKAVAPCNAYGISKAMAEQLWLGAHAGSFGPKWVICRYGNVAGSTGSVIPIWRRALEQDLPVRVTNIYCTRYWMLLQEAVELVLNAARDAVSGDLIVPDLPAYQLGDLAQAIGIECVQSGLTSGEKLHETMDGLTTSETARRMSVDELKKALLHV